MYHKNEIAYLAGIVDGEGHIYKILTKLERKTPYEEKRLLFVQSKKNNGLELCEWAKQRFGGNISITNKKGDNPLYRWQLSGKKAVELALLLKPFLIVKREQIKRIL